MKRTEGERNPWWVRQNNQKPRLGRRNLRVKVSVAPNGASIHFRVWFPGLRSQSLAAPLATIQRPSGAKTQKPILLAHASSATSKLTLPARQKRLGWDLVRGGEFAGEFRYVEREAAVAKRDLVAGLKFGRLRDLIAVQKCTVLGRNVV